MTKNDTAPFFMTHHSPVGAWSSFTMGLPGRGVSIDHETPNVEETADLMVALYHGPGMVKAFPFVSGISVIDNESLQTISQGKTGCAPSFKSFKERWQFLQPSEFQRRLSPTIDEYSDGELTLSIYTPHPALPDPDSDESLAYPCCPGLLMDLTIDNTGHTETAYGLLGLAYRSRGRIRPLDWSTEGLLSGIAYTNQWAMAARTIEGKVFTVRNNSVADALEQGRKVLHNGGQEGGILIQVPPGAKETLTVAFGFFHEGVATQGIAGKYYFNRYFNRVEEVCDFILEQAERIRRDCQVFDEEIEKNCGDHHRRQLFAQAIRGYYASSQLIEADGKAYYTVGEGQYLWRNTMDLAADHIPFELTRNAWVLRNIMDLYIDRYSYHDDIRFADRPGQQFPGGLSFAHDMGSFTSYTPAGTSGYELMDSRSYGYMTTEELLNGIYCFTAYALGSRDWEWANSRKDIAVALLDSMEQRDHVETGKRDGILKGESCLCGTGHEITTYDCLDPSLLSAVGNLYIAVKTWCSVRLLEAYFDKIHLKEEQRRAAEFAARTEVALKGFFDAKACYFRANRYQATTSKVIAAVEPLAIPLFLGEVQWIHADNELYSMLLNHIRTCLIPGNGMDAETGGIRLSSASTNTWPSKTALCVYVLEKLFGFELNRDYPSIMRELAVWMQVAAAEETVSDQIDSQQRTVIGAKYYPRAITTALWVLGSSMEK